MTELDELRTAFPLTTITLRPGLAVRPLVQNDLNDLAAILVGDPEMSWSRKPWSIENVQFLLSHRLAHYEEHGFGPYGVSLDKKLIGMAGAQIWQAGSQSVELLAYIAKIHWGRGLATEVLRWSLLRLKTYTQQGSVFATTRPANMRSSNMVKGLGFQPIGEKREHYGHDAIIWRRNLRNG